MSTFHEPDPVFLQHLAWQTRTALRREDRFARPVGQQRSVPARTLRTAALVLFSLLGGATTVVAAEHLQDRRERELLLAGADVRLETAQLRLQMAQDEVEYLRGLLEGGLISDTEIATAESSRARARDVLERLEIDRAEIASAGRAPRDDLAAPLVAGRDFVTERLEIGIRAEQSALEAERRRLERLEVLFAEGVVGPDEMESARLRVTLTQRALARSQERIALRLDYLAGRTTASEVELLGLQAEARGRAAEAESRIQHVRVALERMRTLVNAGAASSSEAHRLEVELQEAEGELKLAQMELERIAARLGR